MLAVRERSIYRADVSTDCVSASEPSGLTPKDEAFLAAHGGVPQATEEELAQLAARATSRATAERTASFTAAQAAKRIGVARRDVATLAVAGSLLVVDDVVPLVPSWQFAGERLLPGLAQVLAAMAEAGPISAVTAGSFMNTPTTDMISDRNEAAVVLSPAEWLASGGALEPVLVLARTYGEQI